MKVFKDLAIGQEFMWNNTKYSKIADERISCCKVINAIAVENVKDRQSILPSTIVEECEAQ